MAKLPDVHLLLARDLNLIDVATHSVLEASVHEVERMLSNLIRRLDTKYTPRGGVREADDLTWPPADEDSQTD